MKVYLTKDVKIKDYFKAQIDWLLERFPSGEYQDVIGLCKVAKLDGEDGIIDQDYSLNPGRYVGVVIEDDGMTEEEFKAEMLSLNDELSKLNEYLDGSRNLPDIQENQNESYPNYINDEEYYAQPYR